VRPLPQIRFREVVCRPLSLNSSFRHAETVRTFMFRSPVECVGAHPMQVGQAVQAAAIQKAAVAVAGLARRRCRVPRRPRSSQPSSACVPAPSQEGSPQALLASLRVPVPSSSHHRLAKQRSVLPPQHLQKLGPSLQRPPNRQADLHWRPGLQSGHHRGCCSHPLLNHGPRLKLRCPRRSARRPDGRCWLLLRRCCLSQLQAPRPSPCMASGPAQSNH
jgi:hypothetical protein